MRRIHWLIIGAIIVAFCLTIGVMQYVKYQRFGYNGLDLGIYSQTIWSLAHGHGWASSIHDPSYLGDHLELGLLVFVPLGWLPSVPLGLLFAQTVIIAGTALLLARIARHYLGPWGSVIAVGLWLAHPLTWNVALYEFHGIILVLPVLCWTILAYISNRRGWWLLSLATLLLLREDMAFFAVGWAIFALASRRNWRWWLWPLIGAAVWGVAAQLIIRDANATGTYKYLAFYNWLGDSPQAMAAFPLRHPIIFLSHIFGAHNWQTVLGLFIGFGFLPIFRPRYLLPVIGGGAQLLLLGSPAASFLRIHYVTPYLPVLAWASFVVLRDARQGLLFPRWDRELVGSFMATFVILAVVYAGALYGPEEYPWRNHRDVGATPPAILKVMRQTVPANASVLTTFNLLPSLAQRTGVYSLNYVYLGRRQYSDVPYAVPGPIDVAFIDWQQLYAYQFLYRDSLWRGQTGPQRIESILQQNHLTLKTWIDSVALYTKDGSDTYVPTTKAGLATPSADVSIIGTPSVLENTAIAALPGWRQVDVVLTSTIKNPDLNHPLSIRFTLQDASRVVWSSTRLLGQGTNPTTEWDAGQDWTLRYRLAIPPLPSKSYNLRAEITNINGNMTLNRWRGFSPDVNQDKILAEIPFGSVTL